LYISFERLTRFNTPFEKLERVHKELLIKHSIEPKINSKNFWNYDLSEINRFFQYLWNKSLENTDEIDLKNYKINLYLAFEELKEYSAAEFLKNLIQSGKLNVYNPEKEYPENFNFCNEEDFKQISEIFKKAGLVNLEIYNKLEGFNEIEKLFISYKMNFPINIHGFLNILKKEKKLTSGMKRLIWIDDYINRHKLNIENNISKENLEKIYAQARQYREKNDSLNPIELLILAEGTTEEILLPVFSRIAGFDFNKNGVKVISSGGKNQAVKLYFKLSREINLPILMIFDSDASEEAEIIKNNLRSIDDIYIISNGEFEDILPDSLICKAVNIHYRLTGSINFSDIQGLSKKYQVLNNLWKKKGFGEFKKVEFARIIAKNINKKSDLSEELGLIFKKIFMIIDNYSKNF